MDNNVIFKKNWGKITLNSEILTGNYFACTSDTIISQEDFLQLIRVKISQHFDIPAKLHLVHFIGQKQSVDFDHYN